MNTPTTNLTLSAAPRELPIRSGSDNDRLTRLLRLAVLRGDIAAERIIRAQIASQAYRPEPDYPVWTRRIVSRAA